MDAGAFFLWLLKQAFKECPEEVWPWDERVLVKSSLLLLMLFIMACMHACKDRKVLFFFCFFFAFLLLPVFRSASKRGRIG